MEMEEGLYLCKVELKHTDRMLLRYSDGCWWQYVTPQIIENVEGWVGVNFRFEPIEKINSKSYENDRR